MSSPEIFAAGAVLWRPSTDGTQVALVHRPKYDDWTIPKGKLKKGEHLLRATHREVYEETGIRPRLGRRLAPSFYDKDGRPKRVDYWAATADPRRQAITPEGDDVDRMEWLGLDAAARRLSYDRDARVLADFVNGPIHTVPVILLRHAEAAPTEDAAAAAEPPPPSDELRPLTDTGRAQATKLAKLLGCFTGADAISAPTARGVATLLPYALRHDVAVTTDAAFAQAASSRAAERLDALLADPSPLLVCADDDAIADALAQLCSRLDAPVPDEPGPPPGGFWVLHVAPSGLAAIEQHRP